MFFFYDNISCSSGTNYADGQWHLVIQQVAQTGGTSLYVDGNLVASSTRNYADTYQTPYMQLYSTGPIQSLRVDNFRYYNRLLSAGERQALQNESFAASCSDQIRNQDETSVDYGGVCGKIPASGLVAHYGFDGDTTDDGPYANHLSHPPGMTFLSGVRELSLGFNWGPYSPSLKIGTGSTSFQFASGMTASAWVYLESGKDGTVFSRMNGPDGGMNMFANRINESLLMFAMQIDPWNHMAIYLPDVTSSNWTHLVMTTDSKYVYAYFNGERVFIGKGPHATMFPNAAYSNVNDLLIGE